MMMGLDFRIPRDRAIILQNTATSGGGGSPVNLTIAYVATQFVFKWKAPAASTLVFHWGDGTSSSVSGNDAVLVTTTSSYAGAGSYDFWITGDVLDLTYLDISSQSFVSGDVSTWNVLTSLTSLVCHATSITGDVSSWSTLTSLTYLNCSSTSVSGDISSWNTLTSLTNVQFHISSVTGDLSSWS